MENPSKHSLGHPQDKKLCWRCNYHWLLKSVLSEHLFLEQDQEEYHLKKKTAKYKALFQHSLVLVH